VASIVVLRFPPAIHVLLVEEALRARPDECCGILAGRGAVVERIFPARNVARSPRSRYEMAPVEMLDIRRQTRGEGLEILGFYHSHPRTEPSPSPLDIERAYYPDAIYVIVGIEPEPLVRAFRIAAGGVDEITVSFEPAHTA
jgi:desampylase